MRKNSILLGHGLKSNTLQPVDNFFTNARSSYLMIIVFKYTRLIKMDKLKHVWICVFVAWNIEWNWKRIHLAFFDGPFLKLWIFECNCMDTSDDYVKFYDYHKTNCFYTY